MKKSQYTVKTGSQTGTAKRAPNTDPPTKGCKQRNKQTNNLGTPNKSKRYTANAIHLPNSNNREKRRLGKN